VTPQSIRLRKAILDHNVRKRLEKKPSETDD
jgi:predicted membrane GTPase involved in stress response